MNKATILKFILISTVPFVVLTLLFFFLYPYINADKYEQIVAEHESGLYQEEGDSLSMDMSDMQESFTIIDSLIASAINPVGDSLSVTLEEFNILKIEKVKLQSRLDSVQAELYSQTQTLEEQRRRIRELEATAVSEDFVARVKSMLNLEVEELAPTLRKFGDEELVKIYVNSGSMQREKILRALDPAKAADLMSEVML
jgi:flagellar motility protein MotE (MotC chaperone)